MNDVSFIYTRSNSDSTESYTIEINSNSINTIGDFVNWVLSNRSDEWGEFYIRLVISSTEYSLCRYNYKYGKLVDEIPNDISSLNIPKTFYANGGWTAMSYNITIKNN